MRQHYCIAVLVLLSTAASIVPALAEDVKPALQTTVPVVAPAADVAPTVAPAPDKRVAAAREKYNTRIANARKSAQHPTKRDTLKRLHNACDHGNKKACEMLRKRT